MEINIEVRQKQLENLEQFISSSKSKLQQILNSVGWTEDECQKSDNLVICCHDNNHRVPQNKLQEHEKLCNIKKLGYNLKEDFLPSPLNHPTASITIDNSKKRKILQDASKDVYGFKTGWNGQDPDPMTSDRLITTFTPDERLAMYNYAVHSTRGPAAPLEFNLNHQIDNGTEEITYAQRLEEERNMRRRRIKYKAVHTSRKNHKEVLHDVIQNQMSAYEDYLVEKDSKSRKEIKQEAHETRESDHGVSYAHSKETHHRRSRNHRSKSKEKSISRKHRESKRKCNDQTDSRLKRTRYNKY